MLPHEDKEIESDEKKSSSEKNSRTMKEPKDSYRESDMGFGKHGLKGHMGTAVGTIKKTKNHRDCY
jgi:hypothetical protein